MLTRPLTDSEYRMVFEKLLADALKGRRVESCSGLSQALDDALDRIALAHPDPPAKLVTAARAVFESDMASSSK